MILFETKFFKKERNSTLVEVICESCNKKRLCTLYDAKKQFERINKNLCLKCSRNTEEFKKKISSLHFGKTLTQEHKNLISKKVSGDKNGMFGRCGDMHPAFSKKITQEHKDAISRANSGEGHPNYVEPHLRKKKFLEQIRTYKKLIDWRLSCFIRDNFKCIKCNNINRKELQVDHIKPLSLILKEQNFGPEFIDWNDEINSWKSMWIRIENCNELWDIKNGRTLCQSCHKETDTYGNKTKNLLKLNKEECSACEG